MHTKRSLNHKIWDIAWPAILSNISIPVLGLVDAAILGHLGSSAYLGAVSIGAAILSFVYWGFSFLRMGTTGLVATASGAGRDQVALLVLGRSIVLALALALLVILLHPLWLPAGLLLMAPQPEIAPLASSYTSIRLFSAPAVLVTYAVVGWFIGRQNTRWPMLIVLLTNLSNIGLDLIFIVGLGLNSDGAALATLVAEYLGCAAALLAIRQSIGGRGSSSRPRPGYFRQLRDWRAYHSLLRSNRHLFVRTICLLFSFAFFTAMGDNFGTAVLAANTIMLQFILLFAYGLDGFAYAAEALTGNRLGAGDWAGFDAAVKACAHWCGWSALLTSALFMLLGAPLFNLLTGLPEVLDLLQRHHWWLVALPLLAAPSYLLDGIFIGTATTRPMMYTMLASTGLVFLPCWYLTTAWGNHGLWLSFSVFNASRGMLLYACFLGLGRMHDRFTVGARQEET